MTSIASLALAVYRGVAEPARAFALRRSRLAALGLGPADPLPVVEIDPFRTPSCAPTCRFDAKARSVAIDHYLEPAGTEVSSGWLGGLRRAARATPTAVALDRFADYAAFEALVRKRSSRTLPKARKAREAGYTVKRFPIAAHVADVYGVKTSMKTRAGGPVLDYWFLKPGDIATPADRPLRLKAPPCGNHWVQWWGVFLPEPGHVQNGVTVDERLVAYVKINRRGGLLHYADIMGHSEHLAHSVMVLLHLEIMRWLLDSADPMARGAKAVLYGAAEHGREGLLTWKKRAGFDPMRLMAAARTPALPDTKA